MSFEEFLSCTGVQNVKKAYPDFDSLLTRNELLNIYIGMDRSNNFMDSSKILIYVCQRKRENKQKYLQSVKVSATYDAKPKINVYDYVFKQSQPQIEGSVDPGSNESINHGRYTEPIFKGKCMIL